MSTNKEVTGNKVLFKEFGYTGDNIFGVVKEINIDDITESVTLTVVDSNGKTWTVGKSLVKFI